VNLGILIDKAQELADRKDTNWDARCKNWLNEGVEQWARKLPWPTLKQIEDFTFNSREPTARILTLPQYVDKILRVADDTNNRVLRPMANPDLDFPLTHLDNTAGAAFSFRELGLVAVHDQPAAASVLRVQSTVSDVLTVYVAGIALDTAASGTPDARFPAHEELVVGDSSIVSSTRLFVRVDTIGKSKEVALGDILVSTAADGQLARVYRDDFQPKYRQIELLSAPIGGTVFQIEYLLKAPRMRESNDFAPPAIDSTYLIWYCASMIHTAQGNVQEAAIAFARAEAILEREATFEKNAGDQDYRAFPEQAYWSGEDQYVWPIP